MNLAMVLAVVDVPGSNPGSVRFLLFWLFGRTEHPGADLGCSHKSDRWVHTLGSLARSQREILVPRPALCFGGVARARPLAGTFLAARTKPGALPHGSSVLRAHHSRKLLRSRGTASLSCEFSGCAAKASKFLANRPGGVFGAVFVSDYRGLHCAKLEPS